MKRWMALLLAVVLAFGMAACSNENQQATAETMDPVIEKYAGEWVAPAPEGVLEQTQTLSVWLHPDGSGAYNGRIVTWKYYEGENAIYLTISNYAVIVLKIEEIEGKTALVYGTETYFRASDLAVSK